QCIQRGLSVLFTPVLAPRYRGHLRRSGSRHPHLLGAAVSPVRPPSGHMGPPDGYFGPDWDVPHRAPSAGDEGGSTAVSASPDRRADSTRVPAITNRAPNTARALGSSSNNRAPHS